MKLNQQQRSGGACGKGCMMFLVLGILLLVALAGGTYWGIQRFQTKYSAPEPITFPEVTTAWQDGTAEEAQPETTTAPVLESEPAQPAAPPDNVSTAPRLEWREFEKAADRNQKARIELSAAEINGLLNNSRNTRGKAHVDIRDNVGYVSVSIPLDDLLKDAGWAQSILGVEGRYLNGEATVHASPDGDPAKAQISNIRIGNEGVSDDWIDRSFFGMQSVRSLITGWLADKNIESFHIRQNRVYAETRGQ